MLALILAVSMELCPICGNYDGLALYNNQIVQMHFVEDARPVTGFYGETIAPYRYAQPIDAPV